MTPRVAKKLTTKPATHDKKPVRKRTLKKSTAALVSVQIETPREINPQKAQKMDFIHAVGKRKSAIAQLKLFVSGDGKVLINKKPLEKYFPYPEWQSVVLQPLNLANLKNKFDLIVKLQGGGLRAQAEALRLAVARALVQFNNDLKKILKTQGLLTRDARIKERKKPGLKRARKAPQWAKR